MKNKILFVFACLLLLLNSCSEDELSTRVDFSQLKVNGYITDFKTRAEVGTSIPWKLNDSIAITADAGSFYQPDLCFYFSERKVFEPVSPFVLEEEDVDYEISGYFPYLYSRKQSGIQYGLIIDTRHQSKKLDLLFAPNVKVRVGASEANLVFYHQMAKVQLSFRVGGGVDFESIKDGLSDFKISNVIHSAEFNLFFAEFNEKGWPVDNLPIDAIPVITEGKVTYTLYLIPQDIEHFDLSFQLGEKTYGVRLKPSNNDDAEMKLESGVSYNYDLVIHTKGIEILSSSTIFDWSSSDLGENSASMFRKDSEENGD